MQNGCEAARFELFDTIFLISDALELSSIWDGHGHDIVRVIILQKKNVFIATCGGNDELAGLI